MTFDRNNEGSNSKRPLDLNENLDLVKLLKNEPSSASDSHQESSTLDLPSLFTLLKSPTSIKESLALADAGDPVPPPAPAVTIKTPDSPYEAQNLFIKQRDAKWAKDGKPHPALSAAENGALQQYAQRHPELFPSDQTRLLRLSEKEVATWMGKDTLVLEELAELNVLSFYPHLPEKIYRLCATDKELKQLTAERQKKLKELGLTPEQLKKTRDFDPDFIRKLYIPESEAKSIGLENCLMVEPINIRKLAIARELSRLDNAPDKLVPEEHALVDAWIRIPRLPDQFKSPIEPATGVNNPVADALELAIWRNELASKLHNWRLLPETRDRREGKGDLPGDDRAIEIALRVRNQPNGAGGIATPEEKEYLQIWRAYPYADWHNNKDNYRFLNTDPVSIGHKNPDWAILSAAWRDYKGNPDTWYDEIRELRFKDPRTLNNAERFMANTFKSHPNNPRFCQLLIRDQLSQFDPKFAPLDAAERRELKAWGQFPNERRRSAARARQLLSEEILNPKAFPPYKQRELETLRSIEHYEDSLVTSHPRGN